MPRGSPSPARPRHLVALGLFALAALASASAKSRTEVPEFPSLQYAAKPSELAPLAAKELRLSLAAALRQDHGTVADSGLAAAGEAQGSAVAREAASALPAGPITAVAGSGPAARPAPGAVIDLIDNAFVPIRYDSIPEVLDWFEALAKNYVDDLWDLRAEKGLRTNRVARLIRVFAAIRRERDRTLRDLPAAIPIGHARLSFNRDWGRYQAGPAEWVMLVFVTERGTFLVCPYTRQIRALRPDDDLWTIHYLTI